MARSSFLFTSASVRSLSPQSELSFALPFVSCFKKIQKVKLYYVKASPEFFTVASELLHSLRELYLKHVSVNVPQNTLPENKAILRQWIASNPGLNVLRIIQGMVKPCLFTLRKCMETHV